MPLHLASAQLQFRFAPPPKRGPLTRVFRHYELWEEFHHGMWRKIAAEDRRGYFDAARALILQPEAFRECMRRVLREWPVSCEVNLTSMSTNRPAWLWHAGACLATAAPEDVVRSVWPTLTDDEREAADRIAAEVVAEWERSYVGSPYADEEEEAPTAPEDLLSPRLPKARHSG